VVLAVLGISIGAFLLYRRKGLQKKEMNSEEIE